MDWIFFSAVMFVSSIVYYLLVRKVQNIGVGKDQYMIVNHIIPAVIFGGIVILDGKSLMMSELGFLIAIINAFIFGYMGNIAGYYGIKYAPNTGYSVVIQKSYAIYTAVLAVFLFGAELPFYKIIGILIILAFTGFIIIDRNAKKIVIGKWVVYSLIAFLLFGGTTISAKYIGLIHEDQARYLFWVMILILIPSVIEYLRKKKKETFKLDRKSLIWLLLMSSAVAVFYWSKNISSFMAPNVGYTGAINAASNAGLAIFSALIFKDELKPLKMLGIIGVIIGIILVTI